MKSPFSQVADELYSKGLSIIPLREKSKIPAIKNWTKYSLERPTQEEIDQWKQIPNANIGVVLGKASGVIGIDFDYDINNLHQEIKTYLNNLETAIKKGQKGCTMFFKYNGEKSTGWSIKGERVLDLLSDGRHTVMPPSVHPSGDIYDYDSFMELASDLENIPKLPRRFVFKVDELLSKKEVKESHSSADINVNDLREALTFISPDDYDTWVKVGMAIKDVLPEEGFDIWDTWSSKSLKYDGGEELFTKWESFKGSGIGIPTIYWMAIENGFEFSKDKITLDGVVRPGDLYQELEDWRINGIDRGKSTGFDNLDKLIHFKKGEFTVWTGYANNGKSELVDSVALNLMNRGWKFLYCSLEKLPKSHTQSLIHKITGVPIENRTQEQQKEALDFLHNHCAMIGRKDFNPTIDNIYKMAKIYKNVYGLDALVIDPFNYVSSPHKGDIYNHTAYVLEKCTLMAQALGISVQMVAHPKKPDKVFGDKLPRLSMYSISGNADFANMADMILAVYRNKMNDTEVDVLKVRDQDVDSTGYCEFTFDRYSKKHCPSDPTSL